MTEVVCRVIGIILFVVFTSYGVTGTIRVARTAVGPRPWALFAVFEMIEAVQVYALVAGPSERPEADVRSAAVVCVAALCFCAYLQRLFFITAANPQTGFPRRPFYAGLAAFIAALVAAHYAAPVLP
jgi:hypothetical protein